MLGVPIILLLKLKGEKVGHAMIATTYDTRSQIFNVLDPMKETAWYPNPANPFYGGRDASISNIIALPLKGE